jgi:hypothetical protein
MGYKLLHFVSFFKFLTMFNTTVGAGAGAASRYGSGSDQKSGSGSGSATLVSSYFGSATIHATQWIINASYNQRQRFFHLSPEPRML